MFGLPTATGSTHMNIIGALRSTNAIIRSTRQHKLLRWYANTDSLGDNVPGTAQQGLLVCLMFGRGLGGHVGADCIHEHIGIFHLQNVPESGSITAIKCRRLTLKYTPLGKATY